MSRNIKLLLEAWGNWSKSRIGTEYVGIYASSGGGGDSRLWLADKDAMIIDQAVGSLKFFDRDGYEMITAHYQRNQSFRSIGRSLNRRHQDISAYMERAEAYIAGRIDGQLENVS